MVSFLKKNVLLLILAIAILFFTIINLFEEKNEELNPIIFGLISLLTIPFLFVKVERILDLCVLFAPLSIPFLLPFINTRISVPTELLCAIAIIVFLIKILVGLSFKKDLIRHPITILLLLDIVWTFFSAMLSSDIEVSLKRFIIKLTFVFVFYFLFANYYTTYSKKHKIFMLYAIALLIPIANAILVNVKYGFGQSNSFIIGQPFYSDHTIYGACLAFILPFFVLHYTKKNRNLLSYKSLIPLLLVIILFAEFQSYSRASWISLIFCLIFYIATKFKVKGYQMLGFFLLIIVVVSFNFQTIYQNLRENEIKYDDNIGTHLTSITNLQNDASNLERINRWVCAYRMFEERPIVGFGPGTYQFEYDQFQTPEFMTRISTHLGNRGNAHSEYLTYLSETGLPGVIIFILFILYSLHLGLKLIYSDIAKADKLLVYSAILGLITYFTHSFFNSFSDYDKMSLLVYGSIAILVTTDIMYKKQPA